ncbi:MAG: UDPGP type 1 family protein, partial [Lentisphaerae bacterium]|nr:UDPGP type 1 family protein [Lentisphaerota bacterium]
MTTLTHAQVTELLRANGQEHVLRSWDRLDEAGRQRLLARVAEIDFDAVSRMRSL